MKPRFMAGDRVRVSEDFFWARPECDGNGADTPAASGRSERALGSGADAGRNQRSGNAHRLLDMVRRATVRRGWKWTLQSRPDLGESADGLPETGLRSAAVHHLIHSQQTLRPQPILQQVRPLVQSWVPFAQSAAVRTVGKDVQL